MTHIENKIVRLLILLLLAFVGGTDAFADKLYKLVKVDSIVGGGLYLLEQKGRVINNVITGGAIETTRDYLTIGLTGKESYVWKMMRSYGYYILYNVDNQQCLRNGSGSSLSYYSFDRRDEFCKWSVTFTGGVALLKNKGNENRYLGVNDQTKYTYKTYSSNKGVSTTYPHDISFYKLCAYPNLSFSSSSVTVNSDEDANKLPTLNNPYGVEGIVFKSSYNEVASVDANGVITLGGNSGTAVITATYPGSTDYVEDEAKCVITVNKLKQDEEPLGYFRRVVSKSDLTNGEYLIVCETQNVAFNGALPKLDVARDTIHVAIKDSKISGTLKNRLSSFTLSAVPNGYSLKSASGYYIGLGDSDSGIDTNASKYFTNTISFNNDGAVKIDCSIGRLRYNSNSKAHRFGYYNKVFEDVYLYKYVVPSELENIPVVVSQAGLATYNSNLDLDYSSVEGLYAYRAEVSGSNVTLKKVGTVPAGEGVLLRSVNGDTNFSVPVTVGVTRWKDGYNAFKRGTGDGVASESDGKYNYILNVVNNKLGFYKAAGNKVATNRAYLQTEASLSRSSLIFDDEENSETVGVEIVNSLEPVNEWLYNLNGQRVRKTAQGLFIHNGKLVFKKR